jgi:chaperonin GroES
LVIYNIKTTGVFKMENIRPMSGMVIVEKLDEEEISKGGIYVNADKSKRTCFAKIVLVGDDLKYDNGTPVPFDGKIGDKVLIGKYIGDPIKIDDKDCTALSQDDVIAIIED